jgi:DNA-binding transcriptional LysR family regulator
MVLFDYVTQYPEVKIKLNNGTCGENQRELMNGNVDIAFMIWPKLTTDDFTFYQLHKEEIELVTAPKKERDFHSYKETDACSSGEVYGTNSRLV